MATNSVADSPFVVSATEQLNRAGSYAQKIPAHYFRTALVALALLWAVYTVASLFWVIVPAPSLAPAKVTPTKSGLSTASRNDVDITEIKKLNLFGSFDSKAVAAKPKSGNQVPENIEKTKLNLDLQGIIEASDPDSSWAIIGKGDKQKLYSIGDEIETQRGVKISKIYTSKIIISNRGTLEELWLYGKDGKDMGTEQPSRTPQTRAAPGRTAKISPADVKGAKNIGDVVRFMVATENGKMIGYKVRPGRKRELFDRVGLKTDDIVVSVNGIEVNEPQKVREVYQALKTATEANLEVLRDGTTQSIQITMDTEG